jgi:tetratricopeptide (TPR) repeat protein
MRLLAFALAVVSVPGLATGQSPGTKEKPRRQTVVVVETATRVWTEAARTHRAGSIDEPLRTIAAWTPDRVSGVIPGLLAQLRQLLERSDGAPTTELTALAALLTRGLSLHTDIALAERDALAERSSTKGGAAILLRDGQEVKRVDRSRHWLIARQIAAALAAVPGERPRTLAWYRAIANGLQAGGDYDLAAVHLAQAVASFADDALLRLYQGTLHQAMGDPRIEPHVRRADPRAMEIARITGNERPEWSRTSGLRYVPPPARRQLEAAAREFRRALATDPALHEARIRLAHVLGALGDDQEAADTVRAVPAAPLAPFLEFYAGMVLGRSEEHLARYQEAGAAYARAAGRFPNAPSARIGRSRAALGEGRVADALAVIADITTDERVADDDPWLRYLQHHEPDGASMLEAWRASLPAGDDR